MEFLYLESGTIQIQYIKAWRRLIYHQVILKRDNNELTKKIYQAEKDNPIPGECVALLQEEVIKSEQDDHEIQIANSQAYKENIKSKTRLAAFDYLKETQ